MDFHFKSAMEVAQLISFSDPVVQRKSPLMADIVAKRFLVLERRTVFSHLDRIVNFDSQNRPFGFYYCRISLPDRSSGAFATISARLRNLSPLPKGVWSLGTVDSLFSP